MFGDHGLCGLLEEGAHGKSPKCLGGNLGDFGEFCKGLRQVKTKRRLKTVFGVFRRRFVLDGWLIDWKLLKLCHA